MTVLDATATSSAALLLATTITSTGALVIAFVTLITRNPLERALFSWRLEKEHAIDQRKKIRDTVSKYKIHLITSCENLRLRLWHWTNHMDEVWDEKSSFYSKDDYFLYSTTYTVLCAFAYINLLQSELILLDTTIADPADLEMVKFLKIFTQIFSNARELTGFLDKDGLPEDEKKEVHEDHFSRVYFETFPECLLERDGDQKKIKSYLAFTKSLKDPQDDTKQDIQHFLDFLQDTTDKVHPHRWERFRLLYATVVIFLNNYGYDFQKTSDAEMNSILNKPSPLGYLADYNALLDKYQLSQNKEIIRFRTITKFAL